MSTLIDEILNPTSENFSKTDWRIVKKMLGVKGIFEDEVVQRLQKKDLHEPFKYEIERALEYLLWKEVEHETSTQFVIKILT